MATVLLDLFTYVENKRFFKRLYVMLIPLFPIPDMAQYLDTL